MELEILSLLCVSCGQLLQAIVEAECLLSLLFSVLVCHGLRLGIRFFIVFIVWLRDWMIKLLVWLRAD